MWRSISAVRSALCGAVIDAFAQAIGYPRAPVAISCLPRWCSAKTVPMSRQRRRQARLAACRFLAPVYPGDTISAGLRGDSDQGEFESQDRHRVRALDPREADGTKVLEYARW